MITQYIFKQKRSRIFVQTKYRKKNTHHMLVKVTVFTLTTYNIIQANQANEVNRVVKLTLKKKIP